jgi:hypothetical protein
VCFLIVLLQISLNHWQLQICITFLFSLWNNSTLYVVCQNVATYLFWQIQPKFGFVFLSGTSFFLFFWMNVYLWHNHWIMCISKSCLAIKIQF